MTDQHRATPEQWALIECLLELRARVEALEAQHETMRLATLEWGKDVDNHGRWIDDHLKRIMALEAAQRPSPSPAVEHVLDMQERIQEGTLTLSEALQGFGTPAPADSLVESIEARAGGDARTALRVVAAWLRSVGNNGSADYLEREASR
jgi:hypothetical protein